MVAVCGAATSATDAAAISTSLVEDGDGVHVRDGVGVPDGVRDAESADALGVTEPLTLTLLLSRADLLGDREAAADRDGETDADVLRYVALRALDAEGKADRDSVSEGRELALDEAVRDPSVAVELDVADAVAEAVAVSDALAV
jgi:hypothetical protein